VAEHNKNVIPFRKPDQGWIFFTYEEDGRDAIEDWYNSQSFEAQLAFDKLLKQIQKVRNHLDWVGYRHKLHGEKYRKLFELEFIADKRANRILCMFHGEKITVLLCGCYHKGKKWTPAGALDIAAKRAKKVQDGTAKINVKEIEDSI
jgi:hypothetical protein